MDGHNQKKYYIGSVALKNNLFLAPLAGFSDIAFRRLCLDEGAALAVGEMTSVKGLFYNFNLSSPLIRLHESEKPSCIQLFGSDVEFFAHAVTLDEVQKADIIDINMGCPMPKITKNGDGAALSSDIIKAASIVNTVKKSGKTTTAKIRLGLTSDKINALELARALFDNGADAITLHGRTADQLYRGQADWEQIGHVARSVNGKIIGNGDINSSEHANEKIQNYGIFGVAIGRGAIGNPFIFNKTPPKIDKPLVLKTILLQLAYMEEDFPPRYTIVNIRKHIHAYLDRLKGFKPLKNKVNDINDISLLKQTLIENLSD